MEDELIKVYTASGETVASIVKGKLEEAGIPVLLKYESLGNVVGVLVDGLGEVKVMVPRHFEELARRLLA
ncbi:MAG: DUF2007 domain-containing protein [Chloroflexota bacterium]